MARKQQDADLEELKRSTDAFLAGKSRTVDEAYRKRMHAALDELLKRLELQRRSTGDRRRQG